jgi:hypothetical protein
MVSCVSTDAIALQQVSKVKIELKLMAIAKIGRTEDRHFRRQEKNIMEVLDLWTVPVDDDGTWVCEHADCQGKTSPPARLTIEGLNIEPYSRLENPRYALRCSKCGTNWRIWKKFRVAKWYAANPGRPVCLKDATSTASPLRRIHAKDIDEILKRVGFNHPTATVWQLADTYPADDDGIWFIGRAGGGEEIQLESSSGNCPFLIEEDYEIPVTAEQVDLAVQLVVPQQHTLRISHRLG